ncbi:ATP-binding protein [Streptomyces sp. NPDC004393]
MTRSSTDPSRWPDTESLVLPRKLESSPAARHFVHGVLEDWGLGGLEDDATLVVTELVNNAIEHTRTPILRVTVRRVSPETVRVGVTDRGCLLPSPRIARLLDTDGRGLALVEALTKAWGCTTWPWAKCVWADLDVPDAANTTAGVSG